MKKISVIVPVYNIDSYLQRMLDSLIRQSYTDLEIILIDDGSLDNSGKICDEYAAMDSRIRVVHKDNEGVSVARNLGLELSSGDYIGFVDSDDVIDENMYKKLYDNMVINDCDISVCDYVTFSDKVNFEYRDNIKIYSREQALRDIITDGAITNFLWNKLFKKSLFNKVRFPKGKIYEDLYVMPKLIMSSKKVCYDNSKLYGYFKRNNSYVNTYNDQKNNNYLSFCDECYEYLSKYNFLEEDLVKYRCFYIYSAFLQAAKSKCKNIFKDEYMDSYYKLFKQSFKINNNYSMKRKVLFYILYVNKDLFYLIVNLIQ